MAERVNKDVSALTHPENEVNVNAPDKKHRVWEGGSKLAALSTFEEMWVTREEYDENGAGIVHRKCT